MKNAIDPRKAIAVLLLVCTLATGGYILGIHIIGGQEEGGSAAAVISPSPSPELTYSYPIDTLPDGIVGEDAKSDTTPTPSDGSEDAQVTETPAPDTTSPAGSGSSAPAPTSTPAPVVTTPPASSDSSSTGSTPVPGSTNSSGQVYVPGFGYVTPSTEGNTQTTSHGDGDGTIIGTMG
ncbi:MAG: DUF6550 family protein [Oscillospiraceae bacterium]|nr:DUF6550 family protein [Oscillospiraceae bacterium]